MSFALKAKMKKLLRSNDSNNKLKPYGCDIHGSIYGYSRNVIWMEILYSNKDPGIVPHHYIILVEVLRTRTGYSRCSILCFSTSVKCRWEIYFWEVDKKPANVDALRGSHI